MKKLAQVRFAAFVLSSSTQLQRKLSLSLPDDEGGKGFVVLFGLCTIPFN
jgi:hypothetical protein